MSLDDASMSEGRIVPFFAADRAGRDELRCGIDRRRARQIGLLLFLISVGLLGLVLLLEAVSAHLTSGTSDSATAVLEGQAMSRQPSRTRRAREGLNNGRRGPNGECRGASTDCRPGDTSSGDEADKQGSTERSCCPPVTTGEPPELSLDRGGVGSQDVDEGFKICRAKCPRIRRSAPALNLSQVELQDGGLGHTGERIQIERPTR